MTDGTTTGQECPLSLPDLIDAHQQRIVRFVSSQIYDQHLAHDVSQEVWMRVHTQLSRYDPTRASIEAWLLMIASSVVKDCLKRISAKKRSPREGESVLDGADVGKIVQSRDSGPALEDRLWLMDAIAKLDAKSQEFVWRYLDGNSVESVASSMNISVKAVDSRLRRVIKKLTDIYEREHDRDSSVNERNSGPGGVA